MFSTVFVFFICIVYLKCDLCFRLKEIIFKERNSKLQLEIMVHRLQNEIKKLTIELIKARDQQDDHIRHLRTLEKALEKMERQKGQQQAAQVRSAVCALAGPTRTAPLPKRAPSPCADRDVGLDAEIARASRLTCGIIS